MDFYRDLCDAAGKENVLRDEPMSGYTTFHIGGAADYFVTPRDEKTLAKSAAVCERAKVPYFIMGNGSNLLVGDGGYRGVIFHICRTMDEAVYCTKEDTLYVTAGAGMLLSQLARDVSFKGYTGFEYATGIPGTVGGGLVMNAGAYGGEMADSVIWAEVLDREGNIIRLGRDDLDFSYRHSAVAENGYAVIRVRFGFRKGDEGEIVEQVTRLTQARRLKQPLEYPSAGSTFKRPEGYYAGKLIEDCGLKGYVVGGARVSEKHSGFIINSGNATARDVLELIGYIQRTVRERFGVDMEPEVKMLGDFTVRQYRDQG